MMWDKNRSQAQAVRACHAEKMGMAQGLKNTDSKKVPPPYL